MKNLILLLSIVSLSAFAQTGEEALRSHLDNLVGKTIACKETKIQTMDSTEESYINKLMNYSFSIEPGSEYENEFYLVMTDAASKKSWNYMVAYEEFNGSPLGSLVVSERGVDKIFTHTFYGYSKSELVLMTTSGVAKELTIKTSVMNYVVQKMVCPL